MRFTSSVLLVEDDDDHTTLMRRALDRARVANPLVVVGDGEALYWLVVKRPPPIIDREVA